MCLSDSEGMDGGSVDLGNARALAVFAAGCEGANGYAVYAGAVAASAGAFLDGLHREEVPGWLAEKGWGWNKAGCRPRR